MFDPAAISLTSALNPAAIPANAVMLENAGNPSEPAETQQTGGFEAMLALQTTQAPIALPANPVSVQSVPKAAALAAAQAATGKTLPHAAMPLAAIAGEVADTPTEPNTSAEESAPSEPADMQFMANPGVLASIFAAPDRLPPLPVQPQPSAQATAAPKTVQQTQAQLAPELVKMAKTEQASKPDSGQPTVAAAVALARTAVIELDPTAKPELPQESAEVTQPAASVAANLQARPSIATHTTVSAAPVNAPVSNAAPQEPKVENAGASAAFAAMKSAKDQPLMPDLAEDVASPLIAGSGDAPVQMQDAAPVQRAEPRAERVDFAKLVETLNRAREDATPNTVRVSLTHADFGRVSMRFEQDDKGMSVAMSSADPGFARAVTASNEAASTATSTDTSRGQSSQTQTNGNAQGESNRQSQSQRTATPDRPAAQLRDTLRREDEASSSNGIFA